MEIYIYLTSYIILLIGISYYFSKSASSEDYLIGGRNRNSFSLLSSKFAGAVGVSTFITYTGFAYKFGWGVFALLIGSIIGYSLFAFWAAPKINKMSSIGNFYTQGDLPKHITKDNKTGNLTNYITILVQFFWVLLSLVGGAKIISILGIMSYPLAVITTSSVILIYVLLSGFKAVIITDIFQAFIILFFLAFIIYNMFGNQNYNDILSTSPKEGVKADKIIGLVLYGCLSVFGLADRYLLCYAGKDEKTVRNAMAFAIIPILIVAFLLMLIGLSVFNTNSGLDPDMVFIYAIQNQLNLSLIPILLVLFFAGLMSSADTSIFAVSSHLASKVKKENKVKMVRLFTIGVVIISSIFALFWKSIVDITIVGAALRITLAIPMIYILLGKKDSYRFIGSAFGGVIGLILGLLFFGATTKLAITVLTGALLGLVFHKRKSQHTISSK